MKISQIMTMMIDPRPCVQRAAVVHLENNTDLLYRVEIFVLHVEEFGGYSRDEILLKWSQRIVRRLDRNLIERVSLQIRMRCVGKDMYISHKGKVVSGPFKTVNEYQVAVKRYAEELLRGNRGN